MAEQRRASARRWGASRKRASRAPQDKTLEGLLTRTQAAEFLGMSRSGLRYLEGAELTPVVHGKGKREVVYYDKREVEELLYDKTGDDSRKAFALFEEGGAPVDLVTKYGMHHVLCERLWEAWVRIKEVGGRTVVLELPLNVTTVPWCRTYGFNPGEGPPPLWALRAIELVARTPELRNVIDGMTRPDEARTED